MYSKTYSFSYGLTQQSILAYHYHNDVQYMMDVRDVVEDSPDQIHLFEDNPLSDDFFLEVIETGESKRYSHAL